jgi:hypothetical protein
MKGRFSLLINQFGRFGRPFGRVRGAQYNRILRCCDGPKIMVGAVSGILPRYYGAKEAVLH